MGGETNNTQEMSKFWKPEIKQSKCFSRLKGRRGESAGEEPLESQPPCGTEPGKHRCLRKWGIQGGAGNQKISSKPV